MRGETEATLAGVFARLLPQLDERQRRLALGAAARVVGYGGIRLMARVAGVAESTVARGARELAVGGQHPGRVRAVGAGRKRLRDRDPGLGRVSRIAGWFGLGAGDAVEAGREPAIRDH
jgi:hypothetical protein